MKIIKKIKEYNLNLIFMNEIPLDEEFILNNNKYIAILRIIPNCKICSFYCNPECTSVKCSANERKDKRSVIFKKIP